MVNDNLRLYYQLYDLSRQQNEAIQEKDVDEVLSILQDKKEIIEELEGINVEEEIRAHQNPEETLSELQELMEKLNKLEEENVDLMEEHMTSLAQEIKSLADGRKTMEGYSQSQSSQKKSEGKVIDEKG
ncbi:flagellar protein FliT [Halarsenatibacter silvermanii]|uniref:Flagellar protein FliT n=1 Tax=Halarsenatibacter silvermanii TaxID=321763 RepID=A0A1G9M1D8_9FIRM|nr:flagellar protein FliT [Halarsenatibacter silvermanii]SDL68092.1 protein FliT [Halarsenatibacter silvermanii]